MVVRNIETGERLDHIGFARRNSPAWKDWEVRGPRNCPAPRSRALAADLANRYQVARDAAPMKVAERSSDEIDKERHE